MPALPTRRVMAVAVEAVAAEVLGAVAEAEAAAPVVRGAPAVPVAAMAVVVEAVVVAEAAALEAAEVPEAVAEAEVAAPVAPEAATAVAAAGTPADVAEITAVAAAATPPEVATAVGIAVKMPLRHSAIATGMATEIVTAIGIAIGIGSTRRTARMAWVTAIVVEAWASPCQTLPVKHRRRRDRAAHKSDRRYATPCIRHRSRRGSSARPKLGAGRRWKRKTATSAGAAARRSPSSEDNGA